MTGKQHSTFRQRLRAWFQRNKRDLPWRRTRDPYRIWVSEVMLQQTRVQTAVSYFERFVARYPDILALAHSDLQDVLKTWEGMGYYARARNLHRAATVVAAEHGGRLPTDFASLRELPGIGEYIASAVASIAFAEPHAVVDGNVKRVLARVFMIDVPVNAPDAARAYGDFAAGLLDSERPGDHNQAMMELGALICRPQKPRCEECPVVNLCGARASGRVGDYPRRRSRRKVPEYHIAIGVVQKGDRVLITQRAAEGLLGGLWEFPGGKVRPGESPESACEREIREEINVRAEIIDHLTRVSHAYTHFRIVADVYCCRYRAGSVSLSGPVDYRWILLEDIDRYPFPGANHKFIPLLKQRLTSP